MATIMDMVEQVKSICQLNISKEEKITLLNDLILDCYNEMEAQDQNMHPEVRHNNAEAFRIAKDKVRELQNN